MEEPGTALALTVLVTFSARLSFCLIALAGCANPPPVPEGARVADGNTAVDDEVDELDEYDYGEEGMFADDDRADSNAPGTPIGVGPLDTPLPAGVFPDTAVWDSRTRQFFAGSLATGNVYRVAPERDSPALTVYRSPGSDRMTLGLAVDTSRNLLHVCSVTRDMRRGWIDTLDLTNLDPWSGVRLFRSIDLASVATDGMCNDMTLDAQGNLYAIDRQTARVFRVDASSHRASIFAAHPLLGSHLIGGNGIAITPDDATMLVTIYKPARLVAIDMSHPQSVRHVRLHGPFRAGFDLLGGADGIALHRGALYVAMNRHIARIVPRSNAWTHADVVRLDEENGITSLTVADDELYATNGQAVRFALGLSERVPFGIRRVDVNAFN